MTKRQAVYVTLDKKLWAALDDYMEIEGFAKRSPAIKSALRKHFRENHI